MRTTKFTLFLAALLFFAVDAVASNGAGDGQPNDKKRISLFYLNPDVSSNITIIEFMTKDKERHFQDPTPPRFVLLDSKAKFALGIGGVVRGVAGSDFGGIIPGSYNTGFNSASISVGNRLQPRSQALMSAATSEIFVKLVGATRKLGHFSVYTSFNFMGENYTPQLRDAYVDFLGFSIGQRRSTFTDENAISPTIDYSGPTSYGGYHLPQIRYSRMFACEKMQFAVAAEFPTVSATYDKYTTAQPQQTPNVVAYLQRNWDGGHIRATGLYRLMNYTNTSNYKQSNENGWGVQISGTADISRLFTAYFQGVYGQGVANYINGLNDMHYDLVPNSMYAGQLQTLPMWGAYGGLKCNITDDIFSSFTYSYARVYSENLFSANGSMPVSTDMLKYSQYYAVNAFWNVTDEMQIGAEYLRGVKKEHSNAYGSANRINLMVQYNF